MTSQVQRRKLAVQIPLTVKRPGCQKGVGETETRTIEPQSSPRREGGKRKEGGQRREREREREEEGGEKREKRKGKERKEGGEGRKEGRKRQVGGRTNTALPKWTPYSPRVRAPEGPWPFWASVPSEACVRVQQGDVARRPLGQESIRPHNGCNKPCVPG
jgi:hypothetical protein